MRSSLLARAAALLSVVAACSPQNGASGARATATTSAAANTPAPAIPAGEPAGADTALAKRADRGRIEGSAQAKVWLVEISDFQCPYCKQWHDQSFANLETDYIRTGKVRFAYVNFPLGQHRNARAAAEAAMCASAQGAFFPMHDALFTSQAQWEQLASPAAYLDSVATLHVKDMAQWRSCVASGATSKLIEADVTRATDAGVRSTPTFILAGRTIEGAVPWTDFKPMLDAALAAADSTH